ncbi:MAG: S41 family peptidase [Lachnospiraceae bacterium]|nr:S41 family peptidase [Lachnospiraceae bacterium]
MDENNNELNQEPKKISSKFFMGFLVGALVAAAVLLAAFVGYTFIANRTAWVNAKKKQTQTVEKEKSYQDKLDTIFQYLDAYYVGEYDDEEIENGLCKALLANIGDKYAMYYTPEEFISLLEDSSGEYAGIGVSVVMNEDNEVEIYKVFEGTPAEEAGLQIRDIIISADGETKFEVLDDLVSLVRGEPGTTVDIIVRRNGEEVPFTISRTIVQTPTVEFELMDNGIGYIYISEFDYVTVNQFNDALDSLQEQGMKSLIIDVRDNPGGDYDTVVAMADRVLPEGVIISTKDKNGNEKVEMSDEEHQLKLPMVVLINEYTASAAELFSGAISDYGLATLVGTNSYGKGVVQSIFRLSDNSGMKFTTEKYYIPSGRCIDGVGLQPDVEVIIPDEAYEDFVITEEEDAQLQKAIEILSGVE